MIRRRHKEARLAWRLQQRGDGGERVLHVRAVDLLAEMQECRYYGTGYAHHSNRFALDLDDSNQLDSSSDRTHKAQG